MTETIRRLQQAVVNQTPTDQLPIKDRTWTTQELQEEFDVIGFAAPYVVVSSKTTGKRGTMMFKHSPRIYFNYEDE